MTAKNGKDAAYCQELEELLKEFQDNNNEDLLKSLLICRKQLLARVEQEVGDIKDKDGSIAEDRELKAYQIKTACANDAIKLTEAIKKILKENDTGDDNKESDKPPKKPKRSLTPEQYVKPTA